MESFYKSQAGLYDQYRHRMLHGRRPMMFEMPAKRGGVWVDLGGGTGSNLEYFRGAGGEDTLSATFSKVYVVDLTPSLLEVAKARVEEHGWGERVEAVLGDATDPGLAGLPPAGTADVVTISYAVTMIPDWKASIANAKRLLKPGGHLCVCDFTVDPGSQAGVMQKFWTFIFSTDHVHLSPEHVPHLQAEFKQTLLRRGYGTFPYVPGVLKCPYYVYIGRKE